MNAFQQMLYMNYLKMVLLRRLGFKRIRVDLPNVMTRGAILKIGREYIYKEGNYLRRVRLEDMRFKEVFVHLHLCFLDEEHRRCVCTQKATQYGVYRGCGTKNCCKRVASGTGSCSEGLYCRCLLLLFVHSIGF